MENQNYVARAKELMLKTARTTALVIVPLAAAVSAHAGAILPTTNLTCTATVSGGSSGSCSPGDLQLGSLSGIQGVTFFTSVQAGFSFTGGSGGVAILEIGAGGPLSGSLTQNDPVGYSFTLNPSGGSVSGWSITMALGNAFGDSSFGSFGASGSGLSGNGSGTIVIPSGGVASGSTFWETTTLTVNVTSGAFLQISVPGGTSFDYNSAAAAGVPEPGTVGLMGSGLAFLGYLFRRRRRKA